jgi:hypothetical protein
MSPAYTLVLTDVKKWGKNLLIFLAPVALIYLVSVTNAASGSAFTLADFVPNTVTVGAMILYVLNAITDIVRKFVNGNTVPTV